MRIGTRWVPGIDIEPAEIRVPCRNERQPAGLRYRINAKRRPNFRPIAEFVLVGSSLVWRVGVKITIGTFSAVMSATLGALVVATAGAGHKPAETLPFPTMRQCEPNGTHAN